MGEIADALRTIDTIRKNVQEEEESVDELKMVDASTSTPKTPKSDLQEKLSGSPVQSRNALHLLLQK
jgi:hypothetical protein